MPLCVACGTFTRFSDITEWYILCPSEFVSHEVIIRKYTRNMQPPPHIERRGVWLGWCPRCYKALTMNITTELPYGVEGILEVD